MRSPFILALALVTLAACGSKNKDDAKKSSPSAQCVGRTAVDHTQGGCRIRLVSPTPCSNVDLSDGKTVEFAWTTDGTNCETPYKAFLAGNPVTKNEDGTLNNVLEYRIEARAGEVSRTGGVVRVGAGAFEGLTSTDGTFEWMIESFHGSGPASQVIRVKK